MCVLAQLGFRINNNYKLYKLYKNILINKRIASQIIILSDPFLDPDTPLVTRSFVDHIPDQ